MWVKTIKQDSCNTKEYIRNFIQIKKLSSFDIFIKIITRKWIKVGKIKRNLISKPNSNLLKRVLEISWISPLRATENAPIISSAIFVSNSSMSPLNAHLVITSSVRHAFRIGSKKGKRNALCVGIVSHHNFWIGFWKSF